MLSQLIDFVGTFESPAEGASVFDFIPLVDTRSAEPITTAVSLGGGGGFQQADAALHLQNGFIYIYKGLNLKFLFILLLMGATLKSVAICLKMVGRKNYLDNL